MIWSVQRKTAALQADTSVEIIRPDSNDAGWFCTRSAPAGNHLDRVLDFLAPRGCDALKPLILRLRQLINVHHKHFADIGPIAATGEVQSRQGIIGPI